MNSEQDILSHYKMRWNRMRAQRTKYERLRDICDKQVSATTTVDNNWKFIVNVPMEQNLIEMSVWRQSWNINFNVEPMWETDVDMLQPAKYALDYFLEQGDFFKEKRQFELDKATYGTAIFFTGIRVEEKTLYDFPEIIDNLWNKKMKPYKKQKYIFSPCNVALRSFWMDDRAIYQPDFGKVEDCIRQEELTEDEIKNRRWEQWRWVEELHWFANINPPYQIDNQITRRIIVHHYYNKATQDYCIIANYSTLLFHSKMFYRDWELPFALAQHYPVNNCIYWRWIPDKVRYIKAYKNIMMQGALDLVNASKWINIGIGNEWSISWSLYTWMWEVNVWRFNGGIDNVKQFQLDSNITPMANILQIIDDFVIQDTGENIKAPYSSPASTLWEVEIIEQNKWIRIKTVDESRDIALDRALTQTMSNIANFAPKVLCQKTEVNGKIKITYPQITIKNKKVEKKWQKTVFSDDYGKYWFFELKPQTINDNLKIKVTTFSTKTALNALAKNSYTQYIHNIIALAQIDPTLLQKIDIMGLYELCNIIYQYDDKINATTKRDEIKNKNIQLQEQIKAIVWIQDLTAQWIWWEQQQQEQPQPEQTQPEQQKVLSTNMPM